MRLKFKALNTAVTEGAAGLFVSGPALRSVHTVELVIYLSRELLSGEAESSSCWNS